MNASGQAGTQTPLSLMLRVAFASAWAGLLILVGLWLMVDWSSRFPGLAIPCRAAGVTLLAMGEFVFAALVADRLFPSAHPAVRVGVQAATALTFVSGLAILLALVLGVQL